MPRAIHRTPPSFFANCKKMKTGELTEITANRNSSAIHQLGDESAAEPDDATETLSLARSTYEFNQLAIPGRLNPRVFESAHIKMDSQHIRRTKMCKLQNLIFILQKQFNSRPQNVLFVIDKYYAQHKVIKPPTHRSNKFFQISENNLQPWICYFSGRIN